MAVSGGTKTTSVKDAEVFLRIVKYLTELEDDNEAIAAISSFEELGRWWPKVTSTKAPSKQTGKKWLELLNDQEWRVAMELFVSTRIGHKDWSISIANKMQKHPYSEFWVGLFNEANNFFEKVFTPETKNLVQEIDLKLLSVLPSPRTNEDLRHLFFPKDKDFYTKINPRQLEFVSANPVLFAPFTMRQKMKKVLSKNRLPFTHRRQDFLKDLSDKQYLEVFGVLTSEDGADLHIWTWEALKRQVDQVSVIAEKLFNHVMFWYNPLYVPPRCTKGTKESNDDDEELSKGNSWIDILRSKFFKADDNDSDADCPDEDVEDTSEADKNAIIDFVDEIFQIVEEHLSVWSSAEFTDMLQYVPILCYAPGDQAKREGLQYRYLQRFQHEHWVAILKVCEQRFPGPFNGIFEDVKQAVDQGDLPKPWAKWTTFSDSAFAQTFWKEQEKKAIQVNGFPVTFQTYMNVAGAKFVYAQRKEELQKVLKYPRDSDADLLTSLRADLAKCASFLGENSIEVDPKDPEEYLAGLVVGRAQKRGRSDEEVNRSEAEAVAGEWVVDEGLGDSPTLDKPPNKKRMLQQGFRPRASTP